jgi:hypothetical protein
VNQCQHFARYFGIDYSGAETPTASLKGLRAYMAEGDVPPTEVPPSPSPRKYWTRRGVAEWLVERLSEDAGTLVAIDHGLSFPLRYFRGASPQAGMAGLQPLAAANYALFSTRLTCTADHSPSPRGVEIPRFSLSWPC